MFPEFTVDAIAEEVNEVIPEGGKTSFLFDFDKGDFQTIDGRIVKLKELEAVKMWIEKGLRTERFQYRVYDSGKYGVSLNDLVNGDYPLEFTRVEIEREIREALERHPDILSVHSFSFERGGRNLTCSFVVETTYGRTGGVVQL